MSNEIKTLNSSIELGTRSAMILVSTGRKASLDDLVTLDYALLYSREFGGPYNLHPALPNHFAEIIHRREHLPNALSLFVKKGVISVEANNSGYQYYSNDRTLDFVSCLQEPYFKKIWGVLGWICDNYNRIAEMDISAMTERRA